MTQPETATLFEDLHDLIEVIDMGEVLVLIQRDDKGQSDSIAIGPQQAAALLKILEARQ